MSIWIWIRHNDANSDKIQLHKTNVADPGPFWPLDPGCEKSGSGILNQDENPRPYFRALEPIFLGYNTVLKFFHADPGWKKFGSGINRSRICNTAQNCDLRTIAKIVYEVDAVLRAVGCRWEERPGGGTVVQAGGGQQPHMMVILHHAGVGGGVRQHASLRAEACKG
jgi:hypothetical protein